MWEQQHVAITYLHSTDPVVHTRLQALAAHAFNIKTKLTASFVWFEKRGALRIAAISPS